MPFLLGVVSSASQNHHQPLAPTIGSATDVGTGRAYNNGSATVSFTPNPSGAPATSYQATSSPGGFVGTSTGSPITVVGLQSGVTYTFTVVAINAAGSSAPSSASNSIVASTVPQAPTINSIKQTGKTNVRVTFTPGANGGASVTSHSASSSPGGYGVSGASSPLEIITLAVGADYTFTVTSTNVNGTSTASVASSSIRIRAWVLNASVTHYGGAIVWTGTKFVSMGHSSSASSETYNSTDGLTFAVGGYLPNVNPTGMVYGDGRIIALTNNSGSNNIGISTDNGATWVAQTTPVACADIAYGNGLYVAIPYSGGTIYTSPDGITWTARSGACTKDSSAISFGNGVFVVVTKQDGSSQAQTSPDGINWTLRTLPLTSYWYAVKHISGSTFLAACMLGAGTSYIAKTTDNGASWTTIVDISAASSPISIATDGTMVVVLGQNNQTWISDDGGTSWWSDNSSLGASQFGIAYGNGKFVTPSGYNTSTYFPSYS